MMKILLCISGAAEAVAARFELKMSGAAGDLIPVVCRDVVSLERELRTPWALYDLVVLFAGTRGELEKFVALRELLEGIPVLLTLLENGEEICKQAHRLHPRFISFGEGDFSDVAAVLQKMIINRREIMETDR